MSIYGNITNNLAAVFPARWYPTEGDREHYLDVNVELVGTMPDGIPHTKPPRFDEGDGGARGAVFPRERAARGGIPRLVVACGRGAI